MESETVLLSSRREKNELPFCTGVILAVISSAFIGSSFIIKKLSLLRLSRKGCLRAGAGGFGYLRDWMWWLGLLSMGVGEVSNFTAYTFAPASLVTPLGALSVLVSAVLAAKFLRESLTCLGKFGCVLCILGSVVIVIHSPKEQEVKTVDELLTKLHNPVFVHYATLVIVVTVIIIFYLGPRYGNRYVLIYITLCSAVGSLSVMACKGLGLALGEILSGRRPSNENYLITYLFLMTLALCIFIQMNYLNKSLDVFNTSVVTPVYYVMFTTLVIIASALLFDEWQNVSPENIAGSVCGFLVVIVAIFILQGSKESQDFDYDQFKGSQKQALLRS